MSTYFSPRNRAYEVPSSSEEETLINIIIQSQDGEQVYSRIRPDTVMRKLLQNYCSRKNFEFHTMKYLVNGEFFDLRKTAAQIGLQDGDQIDAMMSQDGGGN